MTVREYGAENCLGRIMIFRFNGENSNKLDIYMCVEIKKSRQQSHLLLNGPTGIISVGEGTEILLARSLL